MQRAEMNFFQTMDNRDVIVRVFSCLSTAELLAAHSVSKNFSFFAADDALWRQKLSDDFAWLPANGVNSKQFYQVLHEEKNRAISIYSYEALRYLICVPCFRNVNRIIRDTFSHSELINLQKHIALSDDRNNVVDAHKKDIKMYFNEVRAILDKIDSPIITQLKSLAVACINNVILLNYPISERQEELFFLLQDCKHNENIMQFLEYVGCHQLIYIATSKPVAINDNAMDIDCGNQTKP